MYNLLAIGDLIIDTQIRIDESSAECSLIPHGNMKLCLDYGSKIPVRNSLQCLGGNSANVSVALSKLGLKTSVLSTIGDDANGKTAIRELAKYGVDTSLITVDKKANTRYSIVVNYKEERTILSYSDKKNYQWPKPEPKTDWIYYSGLGEGFEILHENLMSYLKKYPTIRLAFNPGSYLLKFAREYLPEIISRTDVLIVNLEEAETILGTTLEKAKTYSSLIHGLFEKGAKEIVITDAENGAWVGNGDEIWHMKAPPVPVVAKTGAGDAFSAGYLAGRFYNHDIEHALSWGIANSAMVIQKEDSHSGLQDRKGIEHTLTVFKTYQPFEV